MENHDVNQIVNLYNNLYDNKIDDQYIYKTLEKILEMNVAVRSVIYGIVLCSEANTKNVDIHRLHKMSNLNLYNYAEILMLLEQQGIIEETRYVNPLDGYETENGDWHLVQNDYLYKTTQGAWYLQTDGIIFSIIYDILNNKQDFYELMVNQNLEILRKIQ